MIRIVCQISDQDNISYKSENHIGIFRSKSFVPCVFVVVIEAKGYGRNICFNEGFVCTAILTIALLSENLTNSLKVETRAKQV